MSRELPVTYERDVATIRCLCGKRFRASVRDVLTELVVECENCGREVWLFVDEDDADVFAVVRPDNY